MWQWAVFKSVAQLREKGGCPWHRAKCRYCVRLIAMKGASKYNRTKEHGWHQNTDYVGETIC